MYRWFGLGVVGVLAFAGFLIAGWPAAPLLQRAGLDAARIEGSLLDGQALQPRFNTVIFDSLAWEATPTPLARARLGWQLRLSQNADTLTTIASIGLERELELRDLRGRIPLATLAAAGGLTLPILDGWLEPDLSVVSVTAEGRLKQVEGRLRLTRLGLPIGPMLGPFEAEFRTPDEVIRATLRDDGGPLILDADLTLQPDGRYRVTGRLDLRGEPSPQLVRALNFIGQPDPQGGRRFNLTGRLPAPSAR